MLKTLFHFLWFIKLSHFPFSYGVSHQPASSLDISSLEYWMSTHYNTKYMITLINIQSINTMEYMMVFKILVYYRKWILVVLKHAKKLNLTSFLHFYCITFYILPTDLLAKVTVGPKSWEKGLERSVSG